MFRIEVSSDFNQPKISPPPIHKINIYQDGHTTCTYWYVKAHDIARDFSESKDMDLVKKMHETGKTLKQGESCFFELEKNREYVLKKNNGTEFIIKVLK